MKKFGKALLAFIDFGHFINVQNAKGPPDFMQKTRFFILEHNAAISVFSSKMLLP
jgi:hypothetical protein